jgi:putative ABC transport system permease protein
MRRTYGKNTRRTIKDTFGRFAAIFAIVALGVAFLAGLLSSVPDMRLSFDKYFDKTNLYDIRVLGDLGFTDADVKSLSELEGVSSVQPGYVADVLMSASQGNDFSTRLHSFDESGTMNLPQLSSGRFPQNSGECVIINVPLGSKVKFQLGDTLTASENNKNIDDTLKAKEFTVVGFADDSRYFSAEKEYTNIGSGTIDLFLLVPDDSFAYDVYTDIYVTAKGTFDKTCMTDDYRALVDNTLSEVKGISGERGAIRHDEVVTESDAKLSDAKSDLNKAKSDTDTKLADGAAKIADGKKQIADGVSQLSDALKKISDSEIEIDKNEAEINKQEKDANAAFADADKKLADAQSELDSQHETANAEMSKATNELDSYKLLPLQTTAFNVLRGLPAKYPSLTDHLNTLQKDNDRLREIGVLLDTISKMSPEDQMKALNESKELLKEKDTLPLEIQSIMSGEDYIAYNNAVMNLAKTSSSATALAPIALKLGSLDLAFEQLYKGQTELNSQKADLQAKKDSTAKEFADGRDKIADGRLKLQSAKDEYSSEFAKLSNAKQKLNVSERDYEEAKAKADREISDGEKKISDAEAKLSDVEVPEWHVYSRDDNVSYDSLKANIDKVGAIAKVFPFFFFLVAALVASTTMTRMIEDERLQIGTMKSLGYSRGAIMLKYILYAMIASVFGSAFGVAIGYRLFPLVIWNAYKMMYELPTFYSPVLWPYALSTSGAVILCTLLATFGSCRATLREKPASLMLPKAPQAGKRVLLERITPIWRRMKFTHKVTARNIFRYKKRFFMTIIGVAGCTALLVTGFGMRDSFSTITDVQYGELTNYNILAPIDIDDANSSTELQSLINDKDTVSGSITVNMENVKASYGNNSISIYTFIPEKAEELQGFVSLRSRGSGKALNFDDSSVIITERASELLGVKVGDTLSLSDKNGKTASFTVSGICENYVRNYIYMSESTYFSSMGSEATPNMLAITLKDSNAASQEAFGTKLLETGAVGGVSFTSDAKDAVSRALGRINLIVIVIIISAGALALVVLYNLTNINISERIKEIATIKVLGFTDHEVYSYVNRESILLSIMGTLLGLVLGIFLHRYVMGMAEMDVIMFGRSIKALSFVYSAVLTMAFSIFVDLVLRRKLRKISMVESMKAPE